MIPINKFPYTDFHEINLNWVIERIQEMYTIIDEKITTALAPLISDINNIKSRVSVNESNIREIFTRITNVEVSINNINNTLNTYANNFSEIDNVLAAFNEHFINIDTSIESLENITTEHTNNIIDIYNRIADIDPTGSLYVDATNFDTTTRSVSRLEDIMQFSITGGNTSDVIYMQPDLIPGTTDSYYPRVTMTFNAQTNKIELPTELTTGDYPLIIRGTYATNVNVNAEINIYDPLEYSITGKNFDIDGRDDTAIILMCIWSMHHVDGDYENIYDQTSGRTINGMPFDNFGNLVTDWIQTNRTFDPSLTLYVYSFNKEGDLLSYQDITNIDRYDNITIPANTYSIWFGFYVPDFMGVKNINNISIGYYGHAGCYKIGSTGPITEHIVKFESEDSTQYYRASINGIKPLTQFESVDMFTGDVYQVDTLEYTMNLNMTFNDLAAETDYIPSLPYKDTGYSNASIKYNKVSLLINSLDSNNTRY